MKHLGFLLLFYLLPLLSSAQIEFAPPGAVWHYGYTDYAPFTGVLFAGYQEVRYDRDTLIAGKMGKVLTMKRVGQIDGEIIASTLPERVIYQDSFKIYAWYEDRFYQIYDFGVEVGDTLTLSGGNPYYDSCHYNFIVDSIYYEDMNGKNLKNILLKSADGFPAPFWHINEKMGALPHYLFEAEIGCIVDLTRPFPFRCYEDDDFPLYQWDTTACDYYENVSSIVDLEDFNIRIFPNPIHNQFHVHNESTNSYELTVFDTNGHLVHQLSLGSITTKEINCSQWQSGTYIVQVKSGQQFASKKLLKLTY